MKTHLLILSLILFLRVSSQNLVLNPSFEDYGSCVTNTGDFESPFLNYWLSPNLGTPDQFNNCSSNLSQQPPTAIWGAQIPKSGQGIGGIILLGDMTLNSEFAEGQLSSPLLNNKTYCVRFFLSLAEQIHLPISQIGVYFSDTLIKLPTATMPFTPQLQSPANQFFTDESNWMKWQQPYKARGGEKYFIIGNFNTLANTPKIAPAVPFGDARDSATYYYIDDVSIEPIASYYSSFTIGNDSILCDSTNFTKLLSVPAVYDSVRWSTGEITNQIAIHQIGTYSVICYFGDCSVNDTVTFSLFSHTSYSALSDSSTCAFNAPVSITASPGFNHYSWSNGDTLSSSSFTQSGTYFLTVSNTCDTIVDSIHVTLFPTPSPPTVADTAICQGSSAFLLAATGNNIRWYDSLLATTPLNTPPTISTATVNHFTYFATQTIDGCESDRAPIVVNINPLPYANIGDNQKHCEGISLKLETNTDSSFRYLWNTGDTLPFIVVNASNSYWCDVTNICGTVRDETTIEFVSCNECLYAPNAFSPNGDGRNDVYTVFSNCPLKYFQLQIFNRWGEKVFASSDEQQPWDGSYKDSPLSAGVYVYQLILVNELGETTSTKGSITLIR
jgi:gliding motility-associated-like protein